MRGKGTTMWTSRRELEEKQLTMQKKKGQKGRGHLKCLPVRGSQQWEKKGFGKRQGEGGARAITK